MAEPPALDLPVPSQPDYIAAQRRPRATRPSGPAVAVVGRTAHHEGRTGRRAPGRGGRRRRRHGGRGASATGWSVDDGDGRLATGPPRRHRHPGAGPHLAALPRGRPRRGRHPLPGRGQLARLRHPGRPRPADGGLRRRRPHRRAPHRGGPAHPAARPAATTTCSASRSSGAGAGATSPTSPTPSPPTTRCAAGLGFLRELHDERALVAPVRAPRTDRPRPPGLRAGLRRGPAPRRLAPAALRDRPGPGVERRHRRQPPRLPALGRRPDGRGRPGRRGRPARDRRRRRAHHDHPRRQGPRVPRHRRVRA